MHLYTENTVIETYLLINTILATVRTTLSFPSNQVCCFKTSLFLLRSDLLKTLKNWEWKRTVGRVRGAVHWSRGKSAWDVQLKWEALLQEVAPQHEGRGSAMPNEGRSGSPSCGTPSGILIRRWNSVSRGRASVCLRSDIFNLGPYEQQATPASFSLAFVKSKNHHSQTRAWLNGLHKN